MTKTQAASNALHIRKSLPQPFSRDTLGWIGYIEVYVFKALNSPALHISAVAEHVFDRAEISLGHTPPVTV
jgi:hypothetical protein